jgi:hypothetical protein
VEAIKVVLVHMGDIDRAHDYANKVRREQPGCQAAGARRAACPGCAPAAFAQAAAAPAGQPRPGPS